MQFFLKVGILDTSPLYFLSYSIWWNCTPIQLFYIQCLCSDVHADFCFSL